MGPFENREKMKPRTLEEFAKELKIEITEIDAKVVRFKVSCEVKKCSKILTGRTMKSLKSYYDHHMLVHVEEK